MLDLNSYLLYELYMSHRREVAQKEARLPRRNEGRSLTARVLSAVGDGLVASGSMLKRRYQPVTGRRVHAPS
jgi:hypothetical protein